MTSEQKHQNLYKKVHGESNKMLRICQNRAPKTETLPVSKLVELRSTKINRDFMEIQKIIITSHSSAVSEKSTIKFGFVKCFRHKGGQCIGNSPAKDASLHLFGCQ